MTKLSNKFKKPYFGPFFSFLGQIFFSQKIWPCHPLQHIGLYYHAEFQKKLMSQSYENLE